MLSHKKYTAREELCTTKKLQHWQMRPFRSLLIVGLRQIIVQRKTLQLT